MIRRFLMPSSLPSSLAAAWLALFLVAFIVRVAGNDWGIIHYRGTDLPPDIRGTVYTFMPDEREFLACYRSLGGSWARFAADREGSAVVDASRLPEIAGAVLTGRLTFAPEYPTAVTPLYSYLVFFISLPLILLGNLLGLREGFESNAIFRDALQIARYITAAIGVLALPLVYRIVQRLVQNPPVAFLAALLVAFLPVGISIGHLASYNTAVSFFELLTLLLVVRALQSADPVPGIARAALAGGFALASKLTAAPLGPIVVLAALAQTQLGWKDRLRLALRCTVLFFGVYLAFIAYSGLSHGHELYKGMLVAMANAAGGYGPPASTGMIVRVFLQEVLPFSLSPAVYLALILSLPFFLRRAFRSLADFLVVLYFVTWYGLSVANPNNQAYRILTPCILGVVAIGVLLDVLLRSRARFVGIALAAICVANQAADTYLLEKFFLTRDIRFEANEWVAEHIPAGSRIGFFSDMAYAYHPTDLFTDFHWARTKKYRYVKRVTPAEGPIEADWIVTPLVEILRYDYRSATKYDELLRARGFRLRATFAPDLSLGPYRIPTESERIAALHLFCSKILVYEKISPERAAP